MIDVQAPTYALYDTIEVYANADTCVAVDGENEGVPVLFGAIPTLMTRAEYVSKMLSVCHRCGGPGMFTQRVIDSDELVVLGATDAYESRCRYCYDPTEAMQEHLEL